MNNDQEKDIRELNLDELEQVDGGGALQDIINRIYNIGKKEEYKRLLKTGGKPAAAAACCRDIPDLCGYCAAAVTMLK